MTAAEITQRPHCDKTLDQERAARSTIGIMSPRNVVVISEFGKVFVGRRPVNNAKGGGKIHHGFVEFVSKRLRRTCNRHADAGIKFSIKLCASHMRCTFRRCVITAHGKETCRGALQRKTTCSASFPTTQAACKQSLNSHLIQKLRVVTSLCQR